LWSTTELAHVRARFATALTGWSRHSRIIPSCWESWILYSLYPRGLPAGDIIAAGVKCMRGRHYGRRFMSA
jgi:hypothetical protein